MSGLQHAPVALPPGKILGTTEQEAVWGGQELVWAILKREKSFATARIQTPDRPAHGLINVLTVLSQLLKSF